VVDGGASDAQVAADFHQQDVELCEQLAEYAGLDNPRCDETWPGILAFIAAARRGEFVVPD
jgi:hypothetical protein